MINKISLVLFLGIILALSFVSAQANIDNYVYNGTIVSGVPYQGSSAVTGVSFIGFVCSSANCASVSGVLWNGNVISTGSSNMATLVYPTTLASPFGYGVYAFKKGYLPTEISANWAGSGRTSVSDYIYKKDSCKALVSGLNFTTSVFEGNNVAINFSTDSPIVSSGPLDYVPASIADYYKVNVSTSLEIKNISNGAVIYSTGDSQLVNFSGKVDKQFVWNATAAGNYSVRVYTSVPDAMCLVSVSSDSSMNLEILSNTSVAVPFPSVQFVSPLDGFSYNGSVRVEINSSNATSVWWNNGSVNMSYVSPIALNLSDGNYTFIAYANNSVGNLSFSSVNFLVNSSVPPINDTTPPYIAFFSPENRTYNSSIINLNLNYSSDAVAVWWNNGSVNMSYVMPLNLVFAEGSHTLNAYAQDSAGNVNSTSITFSVALGNITNDTTPPVISIISPLNKEYNSSTIRFEISTDEPCVEAWIVLDGNNYSLSAVNATLFSLDRTLANGNYTVTFYAKDIAGNIGIATRSFSVDKEEDDGDEDDGESGGTDDGVGHFSESIVNPPVYLAQPEGNVSVVLSSVKSEGDFTWLILVLSALILLSLLLILLALIKRR